MTALLTGQLMTGTKKLCVLTVHGIGFQQPPSATAAGYADRLHGNLREVLGGRLGSDPERKPGGYGPVYVMSARPGTRDTEWGLSRLGHCRGTSVAGAIRLVAGDAWAALHEHAGAPAARPASPSLRPRDDLVPAARQHIAGLLHRTPASSGLMGTILALEDDVVAYVCRNDLRERIKEFIAEALRRLLARPDVAGVVVNAHSQGTVAVFDVLRQHPADPQPRVRALVTAGSPLRKYADLFSWGHDAGGIQSIRWLNFWDAKDPVADPLDPPATWRFGRPAGRPPGQAGLLRAAAASPGDAVVISPPVYPPFFDWVPEAGARLLEVPLSHDPAG